MTNEQPLLITLEAARVNAGYTRKSAAPMFGVHVETLSSYERDSSKIPFSFIEKAESLYKVNRNSFFIGKKSEFIRTLREEVNV